MADFHWMNLLLALFGSLAAFGALNKMRWGTTRPCLMGATLLIALGLAGQWLSLVREEWLQYVDTALYGGVLALLVASQRVHTWFLERWANPIASAIAMFAGCIFVLGLLSGCALPEAPQQMAEIPVHTYDRDGVQMRLMPGPCVEPRSTMMIAVAMPQHAEKFRAIESIWPMRDGTRRPFSGCWAELTAEEAQAPEPVFVLVFEDGQAFGVGKVEFLKKRGGA